ncbi:DUF502 domain-containing protein [Candidatus Latescibacterota bacterium]
MTDEKEKKPTGIFVKLRAYFTTGLLVLAPTMVSIWIFIQAFRFFDGILGKLYAKFVFVKFDLPFNLTAPPGLGLITLVILVIIIGILARLYVGKKMFTLWEKVINQVPLINRIYIAVRQLSDAFVKGGSVIFKFPVIVEYPRKGLYSIGFLTRKCEGPFCQIVGTSVSTVFIPTTPNPTSGVLIFVPNEDIIPLEMSVEDAMKLIISAGTVTPDIKLPVVKAAQ